jgi:fumarate reductase subunit C
LRASERDRRQSGSLHPARALGIALREYFTLTLIVELILLFPLAIVALVTLISYTAAAIVLLLSLLTLVVLQLHAKVRGHWRDNSLLFEIDSRTGRVANIAIAFAASFAVTYLPLFRWRTGSFWVDAVHLFGASFVAVLAVTAIPGAEAALLSIRVHSK